jgi:hypothetical protein
VAWKKRKKKSTKKSCYSFSKELRKKGLSNDRFEIMLNNLHLEDIIALKLELASKNAAYYLYGVPIWYSINKIVKEAIFKFAMTVCSTPKEVCTFLNITYLTFYNLRNKYIKEKEIENEENSSS